MKLKINIPKNFFIQKFYYKFLVTTMSQRDITFDHFVELFYEKTFRGRVIGFYRRSIPQTIPD